MCLFIRVTFLCTSVKYKNVHFLTTPLTLSQSSFFSIPKLLANIMKIEIDVFVRFSHRVSTTLFFSFCFLVSVLCILILSFLWLDMSTTRFTIIIKKKNEELTPTRPCFKYLHSLYYFNLPINLMRYVILLMVYSTINITPILWVINWRTENLRSHSWCVGEPDAQASELCAVHSTAFWRWLVLWKVLIV